MLSEEQSLEGVLLGEGNLQVGLTGERGPRGFHYTPSVSQEGDLSWTNNGGLKNPETVNIKGPQGIQGETGAPAGFDTPTAVANTLAPGTESTVVVEASGPDTAKKFDFTFGIPQGLRGEQGIQGERGEKGESGVYLGEVEPEDLDIRVWINPNGSPDDSPIVQLVEFPEPASGYSGIIYQYIGETTDEHTNGYFYQCVENESGEYVWVEKLVQPSSDPSKDQTITGLITYETLPESTVTPTKDTQLVTKEYVDSVSGDKSFVYELDLDSSITFTQADYNKIITALNDYKDKYYPDDTDLRNGKMVVRIHKPGLFTEASSDQKSNFVCVMNQIPGRQGTLGHVVFNGMGNSTGFNSSDYARSFIEIYSLDLWLRWENKRVSAITDIQKSYKVLPLTYNNSYKCWELYNVNMGSNTNPTRDNMYTRKSYVDTSVTNAISTVSGNVETVTGALTNLHTTDKTNIVNAINELVEKSGEVKGLHFTHTNGNTGKAITHGYFMHNFKPEASSTFYNKLLEILKDVLATTTNDDPGNIIEEIIIESVEDSGMYGNMPCENIISGLPELRTKGNQYMYLNTYNGNILFRYQFKVTWDENDEPSITSFSRRDATVLNLRTDNFDSYIPEYDYNPATKKYVDDKIAEIPTGGDSPIYIVELADGFNITNDDKQKIADAINAYHDKYYPDNANINGKSFCMLLKKKGYMKNDGNFNFVCLLKQLPGETSSLGTIYLSGIGEGPDVSFNNRTITFYTFTVMCTWTNKKVTVSDFQYTRKDLVMTTPSSTRFQLTNANFGSTIDPSNANDYTRKSYVDNAISKAGGGDMLKSVYDTDNDGVVDSAASVNGHTILSDVPANAKFTDTTYSEATTSSAGLMSSADKTSLNSLVTKLSSTTEQSVTNWNTAYTNSHTHSNKSVLDGISSSDITKWNKTHIYSGTSAPSNTLGENGDIYVKYSA